MRVGELVRSKGGDVVTIRPDSTVGRAVRLLMDHRIGGLPVVNAEGAPVGFVAERDIVRALDIARAGVHDVPIERIMRRPPPTCSVDDSLNDVMTRMTRERLRHLVVLERDRLAGVLSVGDLVHHRLRELEIEAGVLRDYVAARRAAP
jgi:CBS domain-containing protein